MPAQICKQVYPQKYHIVEELTMYFFAMGATDIRSSVRIEGGCGRIEFDADYSPEYEDRLNSLEKYLNVSRAGTMKMATHPALKPLL